MNRIVVQTITSQDFKGHVGHWSDWAAMTGQVLKLERSGRSTVYVIGQALFDRLVECMGQPEPDRASGVDGPAEPTEPPKETDQ